MQKEIEPEKEAKQYCKKICKNIVRKDCKINVGKIYDLKKDQELPTEIDSKFFNSFKQEGII